LFFYSPLRGIILGKVMGLTPELRTYVTPGAQLAFLTAIFWGYSAMLRGALSAMRRTGDIAVTAPIRLSVVAGVCGMAMLFPYPNGAMVGILALSSALASESIFLALRLRHHLKAATNVFCHQEACHE
jgi:Na+-driven multidrug efflux pump